MSDGPDDDDLLSQAEQETANALTRGQCCASETRPLRFQIISNLLCDACQDMSFRVGNVLINGALYRKVAEALREPGHRLHIKIDTNLKKMLASTIAGSSHFNSPASVARRMKGQATVRPLSMNVRTLSSTTHADCKCYEPIMR
jgi:hypothetical protein